MTLWDIFSLVEYVCNKNFDGNVITPNKFAELIKITNIEHFRDKYGLPEEYRPGSPIPSEYSDITRKNTDDLKAFKVRLANRSVVNGVISFPTDYVHLESVVYNYSKTINNVATSLPRPVEILREAEFASREGNYTKRATTANPYGIIRSDGVHIRPITITACDYNYYKYPRDPVFSCILSDGYATYDPANSIELEWPNDEMIVIAKRCLEYIGVNLRESEIVAYANTKLKEG